MRMEGALRKSVSSILRTLTASNIDEQSKLVSARVLALPSFRQCQNISCYLSMPSAELNTSSIISEILGCGKTLFVPKIDKTTPGRMDFVRVYNNEDLNSLPAGLWGIKEPTCEFLGQPRANALDEGLDMIIVPGVAFDRSMSRLGHGKGYYDRYLSSYTAAGRPPPLLGKSFALSFSIALSLQEQMMEEGHSVPVDDSDWKVDMVVLPSENVTKG
ncbi:5-formyltetrahydrofolate cyclo-ligase [Marasmius fiardii PR-910]|nr:5-formyltetrahydrofolate cyclo-ligase [Marasmius fiardii PR-910]